MNENEEDEPDRLRRLMGEFPQGKQKDDYRDWTARVGVFNSSGLAPEEIIRLEAQVRSAKVILGVEVYPETPKHNQPKGGEKDDAERRAPNRRKG